VIVDLGTGDGRAVLAQASAEPGAFVIGIDANAAAMVEASRRASRARTRVVNACFLVEAAESLPGPLGYSVSLVCITLPWGSLLRGVLGLDASALLGIASIVAPGGRVEVLASAVPTDQIAGLVELGRAAEAGIAAAWKSLGFALESMRPGTRDELLATRSSWARRLGDRPVWRLSFQRCEP